MLAAYKGEKKMALKLSELTKKEQETILKDKNLAQCPNCGNIVQKSDNYCGACGVALNIERKIAWIKKEE